MVRFTVRVTYSEQVILAKACYLAAKSYEEGARRERDKGNMQVARTLEGKEVRMRELMGRLSDVMVHPTVPNQVLSCECHLPGADTSKCSYA